MVTPRLLYGNLADLRTAGGLLAPFASVGYAQDGKIPNVMSFSLGLLIDPSAFVIPKLGDVGPYPRTYARGPGFQNHDLSIFKNIPFDGERRRYLQLRFELFNAFNHTQFTDINIGTQLMNSAGQIGVNVFGEYQNLQITNNIRPAGATAPLGQHFGEYNAARGPRIIQLAAKFNF
ncbi:MAG: hypothetical protein ACREEM_14205 [Blastocatellia bacterium]